MDQKSGISREKSSNIGLNKPFSRYLFYLLLFLLPFGTKKIFFTDFSFYADYHAFYNSFYIYLTDLLVFGLILTWIIETWLILAKKSNISSAQSLPFSEKGGIQSGRREKSGIAASSDKNRPSRNDVIASAGEAISTIWSSLKNDKIYQILGTFWLILAVSTLFSREISLGLYKFVKISEFILLFVYIRENISISREKTRILWLILATLWFQAGLAIYQYINQKSAGLRILGEEFLAPGLAGIAEFASSGISREIIYRFSPYLSPISEMTVNLRAYGTLPHPNVLAALLFVGLMMNLYLIYNAKLPSRLARTQVQTGGRNDMRIPRTNADSFRGFRVPLAVFALTYWRIIILSLSLILITTGIVVTFTRSVWAVSLAAIIFWIGLIFWKIRKPERIAMQSGEMKAGEPGGRAEHTPPGEQKYFPGRIALIVVLLLISLGINVLLFGKQIDDRLGGGPGGRAEHTTWQGSFEQESFAQREQFNDLAFEMLKQNPITGTGLGSFIIAIDNMTEERVVPHLHQPVHNIYLLIAAESGIFALIIFIVFLYYIAKSSIASAKEDANQILRYSLLVIVISFLFLGLIDHYLWTIQQGSLVFWIMLGLAAGKN